MKRPSGFCAATPETIARSKGSSRFRCPVRIGTKAIERSKALRELHDVPEVRLQHASLLRHAGERAEALELFSAGARDPALDTDTRMRAYRGAVELAQELRRFPLMESLAGEAISLAPEATELHWARAFARFRQSRNAEALADIDAAGIVAEDLAQAELLSRILYRSDDVGAAIARVVELSDRFDRPETLELAIIITSQRQPDRSPLPDDLRRPDQGGVCRVPATVSGVHFPPGLRNAGRPCGHPSMARRDYAECT